MASKAGRNVQEFEEDWKFFERCIHDVLVYTLTKCGLPESSLSTTDCTENIYRRKDFVKIAGASVLRISLVMRDKWKEKLKSETNSSEFNCKDIVKFTVMLAGCYLSSQTRLARPVVEIFLASYNEIWLYFYSENIDIDFNEFISLCTGHIVHVTGLNRNNPEKFEELFDSFDDISGYTEWITDFIARYAIPYGSKNDVSNRFEDDSRKFMDSFRFFLSDRFSAIADGRSENVAKLNWIQSGGQSPEPPNLPMGSEIGALGEFKFLGSGSTRTENISEHLSQNEISKLEQRVAAEGSKSLKIFTISNDSESMEPQKLPTGSEIDAERINKSLGSLSTCTENVSEHLAENNRSCDISSEVAIEQDLGKTSLDVEGASPEIHGVKVKSKITKKEKDIGKRIGILVLSSFLGYAFLVMCFKIYTKK